MGSTPPSAPRRRSRSARGGGARARRRSAPCSGAAHGRASPRPSRRSHGQAIGQQARGEAAPHPCPAPWSARSARSAGPGRAGNQVLARRPEIRIEPSGSGLDRREPVGIGRVGGHPAVEVRRAVGPPGRPPLAERHLGRVDPDPCGLARRAIAAAHGGSLGTPRVHQLGHQRGAPAFIKGGIGAPPQPSPHHEVAAVGSDEGRRHAASRAGRRGRARSSSSQQPRRTMWGGRGRGWHGRSSTAQEARERS